MADPRVATRVVAAADGRFRPLVRRAEAQFADALVGVVAFGSWARGQAGDGSDVDVLIILAPGTAVTRDLYRPWDRAPLRVDDRTVDPHFVTLPAGAAPMSALWAEVARDGIVVHDTARRVARTLERIRRHEATEPARRVTSHGQPYWVIAPVEVADAES